MTIYTQRDEDDAFYIDGQQQDFTFSLPFSSRVNRDIAWEALIEEAEPDEVFS